MFYNYVKTATRSLLKNPLNAFINIFGLSMAIGVALVVYAFVSFEKGADSFHEFKDEIYMATVAMDRDGRTEFYGMSPIPAGPAMLQDFAQVTNMTRVERRSVVVSKDRKAFHERIHFVDNGFLEMFTFPLALGDPNALSDDKSIILSDKKAKKYFGDANPIGAPIQLNLNGVKKSFRIAGVTEPLPKQSTLVFDFLINFSNLHSMDVEYIDKGWGQFVQATFIQVPNAEHKALLKSQMTPYIETQNGVQQDWQAKAFSFEPLTTLYEKSNDIRGSITGASDLEGQTIITIIGVFIILLACFNYINIAIVSATKRLKEIGVRKVMGSNRVDLIFQFLVENAVLTLVAAFLGLTVAYTFLIPQFEALFDLDMGLSLVDINLWVFLLGLVAFTALGSGAYPAFYIARFDAKEIFHKRLTFGKKNPFTKVFLVVQLILACITVVCGIMIVENEQYQSERSWGYDQDQVLALGVPDYQTYDQFRNLVQQNPDIDLITGTATHLGLSSEALVIETLDRKYNVMGMSVSPEYAEVTGLKLLEGRHFLRDVDTESNKVLVNETLVKRLGWDEPLGKTFKFKQEPYTVVGVLKDYHQYSFWSEIQPTVLRYADEADYKYLVAKVASENLVSTYNYLQETWEGAFLDLPFEGHYQNEMMAYYFQNISGHGKIISFVAFLSVLLSSLGLYGLVSLNTAGRMKEFSVRRVLGAGTQHISRVINKEYVGIVIVAMLLAGPVSYYLMVILFDEIYDYYKPITVIPVLISVIGLVLVIGLTIMSQIRKVVTSNPVEGLRSE